MLALKLAEKRKYQDVLKHFTFSGAEADSSQEFIAHHGLFVPDGQLQTHLLQLLQSQPLVQEDVVVVGVQVLLHHLSLLLCGFRLHREQVAAGAKVSVSLERLETQRVT